MSLLLGVPMVRMLWSRWEVFTGELRYHGLGTSGPLKHDMGASWFSLHLLL